MKKGVVSGLVFLVIVLLVKTFSPERTADIGEWYSILPPLIAVTLAFATHRIILSLAVAVFMGGILYKVPGNASDIGAWGHGLVRGFENGFAQISDPINLQILTFVFLVLITINVISATGGFLAMADGLKKYAKGKKSTQLITAILGVIVFIDDYANTMIVGPSMRPLADKNGVSRAKLAFLVDATSAPVAGLAIISTWIGYEVGLFNDVSKALNLGKDGYAMFFDAIPFRFYCIFMIMFMFIHILMNVDFGPMRRSEARAKRIDQVMDQNLSRKRSSIWAALIPLLSLIGYLLVALWFDGKGDEKIATYGTVFSLDYMKDVISSASNNILILAHASVLGLVLAIICGKLMSDTTWKEFGFAIIDGAKKSLLPISILVLAWCLKAACGDLNTGKFLAATVGNSISPILFPMLLFFIGALTAFATGTSWGTMAILIPTAIPVAYYIDGNAYGLITIMSLASILDGAIFGDHCSPISDTTIMSSIASDCDHMEHVRTQLPYSLFVGVVAILFGYLPSAAGISGWTMELIGVLMMILILAVVKKFQKPLTNVDS